MTPDRINSTGEVALQSERLESNLRSGNSYTRVFTGSFALIQSQRLIELSGGATQVVAESVGDGNYRLTATYPWDVTHGSSSEPPINTHELEVAMESVDVFQSDIMLAQLINAFGSLAGANGGKAYLKGATNSFLQQTEITAAVITSYESHITTLYSGGQATLMLNLFRGIAQYGQTSARQFKTTYSRRITAATPAQIVASETGVGQIFTSGEVATLEGVPSVGFFNLNTSYLWLKAGPRVKTTAGQKTEVAYEYLSCLYAWSGTNTAYGAATLLSF